MQCHFSQCDSELHTITGFKMLLITVFLLMALGKSITCIPQDLSGKMFIFPYEIYFVPVEILTPNLDLGAATVCLRFFTDITREYALFHLATRAQLDSLHLIVNSRMSENRDLLFVVNGESVTFHGHKVKLNAWQSVCGTWDSSFGLTQLWLNGSPSSRKFSTTSRMKGNFTATVGQEQSSHRGKPSTNNRAFAGMNNRPFVGMLSDLQMWDYVLSQDQIQAFNNKDSFPNGNILTWASLEFQISDPHTSKCVVIEDEQK